MRSSGWRSFAQEQRKEEGSRREYGKPLGLLEQLSFCNLNASPIAPQCSQAKEKALLEFHEQGSIFKFVFGRDSECNSGRDLPIPWQLLRGRFAKRAM